MSTIPPFAEREIDCYVVIFGVFSFFPHFLGMRIRVLSWSPIATNYQCQESSWNWIWNPHAFLSQEFMVSQQTLHEVTPRPFLKQNLQDTLD